MAQHPLRTRHFLEYLETRIAPATFLVSTTSDSGPGSFRQAILDANALPGADVISFEFAFGEILFQPTSPLPTIVDTLEIRGDTNPQLGNLPRYILSGLDAGFSDGLSIQGSAAAGSVIQGLTITGFHGFAAFKGNGIEIRSSSDITVKTCFIGSPTKDGHGNTRAGIYAVASNQIHIGEAGSLNSLTIPNPESWGSSNIIGGNNGPGILIDGGYGHTILGNLIGLDRESVPIPNSVGIDASNANVTIGSTVYGSGNVVSANIGHGIKIKRGSGSILRNHIGTDIPGTHDLGNGLNGVSIEGGSVELGGEVSGARNLISGNDGYGVVLENTSAVKVQGNYIGLDFTGTVPIGNDSGGVYSSKESTLYQIGGPTAQSRNVISGNHGPGISGALGEKSSVIGNYIGVNANGTAAVGNLGPGIELRKEGGKFSGIQFNVISGNSHGIILDGESIGISNNIIGLDATGSIDLGNLGSGILIQGGSATITLNTISGNEGDGIHSLSGVISVIDNRIGTNSGGTAAVPNSAIGIHHEGSLQNALFRGNLVSGNLGDGMSISGPAVLIRNLIGTDVTGQLAMGNGAAGIRIHGGAAITIGSNDFKDANIICANGTDGILGNNVGPLSILNNQIGLGNNTKYPALGNLGDGISLSGEQLAFTATGNIIGANAGHGLSLHLGESAGEIQIRGNSIGVVSIGPQVAARGNFGDGIHIEGSGLLITDELHVLNNQIAANNGAAVFVNEVQFESDDLPDGRKQPRGLIALNTIGGIVDPRNPALSKTGGGVVIKDSRYFHIGTIGLGNAIAGLGSLGIDYHSAVEIDGGFSNTIAANHIGTEALSVGSIWIHGGSHHVIGHGLDDPSHIADYNANALVGAGILAIGSDQLIVAHNSIAHAPIGITIAGGQKPQLLHNSIFDSDRGFDFDGGGNDAVVANNFVQKTREFGIGILGDRATIKDNLIEDSAGWGLSVQGVDAVITGNHITQTGNVGMRLWDLDRSIVAENQISDFQNAGLWIRTLNVVPSGIVRGNQIYGGNGAGIQIEGSNFELSHNLIYGNTGIAIDLGADGNTANDPRDADTGPNGLQNTVAFRTAVLRDGSVILRGGFEGAPLRTLRLEFFSISTDSKGIETSAQFLSEAIVETDGNGYAALPQSIPAAPENSIIVATVTDVNDRVTSEAASTTLITPPEVIAVGVGAGAKGIAKLIRASVMNEAIAESTPYGKKFRGGVRVAHADIDGDGLDDLITAPDSNGRMVRGFSGFDGTMLTEWEAAPRGYRGGISVAAGDVDGDGNAEIVTALGSGTLPTVKVRDGMTGDVESSFRAFTKSYRAGLNLSMGDLDGDGDDDIVASTRSGIALVKAFTATGEFLSPLIRPFAGQASIGAFTAVIPATDHSAAQIAVGSGVGARGAVEFFDVSGSRLIKLHAFDGQRLGAVRVASADIDGDGIAEIIATRGAGYRPHVEEVKGGPSLDTSLFPPTLRNGIFLG